VIPKAIKKEWGEQFIYHIKILYTRYKEAVIISNIHLHISNKIGDYPAHAVANTQCSLVIVNEIITIFCLETKFLSSQVPIAMTQYNTKKAKRP